MSTHTEPHDRFENDRDAHPDWIVEHRPCVFCSVLKCGCPNEPDMVLIPANVVLGEE